MDCLFCKIIKGEIPCTKIYEDDNVLSFLDIYPMNLGHCLVLPKEHCEILPEMKNKEIFEVIKKITSVLLKFNSGVNVLQNNGAAAGQGINHVHFHLIPRNDSDGVKLFESRHKSFTEQEIKDIQHKIKTLLNNA